MISEVALKEFRQIWKEELGEDLPEDLAVKEAISLLTFFDHIYRPVKKSWLKAISDKKKITKT